MNSCTLCQLPVLELDGQFENLEPYYVEPNHPAAELAGECHSSCIASSEYGSTWHAWRVHNYSTGRGYRVVAEQDGWTVLVHARHPELLAFHIDGSSVGGERASKNGDGKAVDGGVLVSVDEEFTLRCDDVALVDELKVQLKRDGRYPIARMLDALGISDRVRWPQALDGATFVLDKKLQGEWTRNAIGMSARYAKYLPDPVVPFWKKL